MRDSLLALTDILGVAAPRRHDPVAHVAEPAPSSATPLTQAEMWHVIAEALTPGDLVFADQGTAFYGMGGHRLHHGVLFVGQPLWASIGYTLPALVGGALGAPDRRPVVLIGDGAAQLTIAELGSIIRLGIPAVIVLVNNDGYTVERAIHGPGRAYNDIAAWRWTELPSALGADAARTRSTRVETAAALAAALDVAAAEPAGLHFIEAVVDRLDVPPLLSALAAAAAAANSRTAR